MFCCLLSLVAFGLIVVSLSFGLDAFETCLGLHRHYVLPSLLPPCWCPWDAFFHVPTLFWFYGKVLFWGPFKHVSLHQHAVLTSAKVPFGMALFVDSVGFCSMRLDPVGFPSRGPPNNLLGASSKLLGASQDSPKSEPTHQNKNQHSNDSHAFAVFAFIFLYIEALSSSMLHPLPG